MRIHVALCFVLPTMLVGCASPYIAPASGPTAKVRFKVHGEDFFAGVFPVADDSCNGKTTVGAILGAPRWKTVTEHNQPISMIGGAAPDPRVMEKVIRADRPFVFHVSTTSPASTCELTMSFAPKENGQYEATISRDATHCYVLITQLTEDSSKSVTRTVEPSAKKNLKSCNH